MLRLVAALSVLAVALAVAFDIATLVPHTTVRVTSIDGRQATVPLQVPKAYVWADPKLVRTLLASEVSIASPATAGGFRPTGSRRIRSRRSWWYKVPSIGGGRTRS
jgi:hypothetical protein